MYSGPMTDEIREWGEKYRQIFGYDANWEMVVDCDDADYWLDILKECVNNKIDVHDIE